MISHGFTMLTQVKFFYLILLARLVDYLLVEQFILFTYTTLEGVNFLEMKQNLLFVISMNTWKTLSHFQLQILECAMEE